ncbi:sodium-coupled monocarboxylate transporter 2-like isoform X2 [Dermacentor albipictus]|uniref:sodium-coupled monocarboxylate transporter 2-like isoform X2 n=1 Tax=Dermacentor albipictus TaxID=60249 RepID=UPI0038FC6CE0
MAAPSVPTWDYVVFVGLTALSLGAGLYLSLRRRSRFRSKDETFLGSRTIGTLPLAVSMVASNVTASGLIAFTAHYYAYGFHTLWAIPVFAPAVLMVAYLFLPVLYELKITSVFEYLRMRYGNGVGVASSVIYFVLSQAIGVTGLYCAAVAMSTVFPVSTVATTVIIGVTGTVYTALGGLRSVVWADCVQTLIMAASPLVIIAKIAYDSSGRSAPASNLEKLDVRAYIFRTDIDLTTDETVWAASVAAFPYQLLRLGLDQMITQRFLAARSLPEARMVTFIGAGLLSFFYAIGGLTALTLVFWFRDCDPVLSGSISRYDQFCISLYSAASGPFAGIMILAFLFPWANARGTAMAALAVFLIQTWQTTGRFLSRIEAVRMIYSVESCPFNSTLREEPSGTLEASEGFLLYRLSSYWCCLLSACSTVLLGLVLSLLIGGPADSLRNAARLSTPVMLKFWQRIALLQHLQKICAVSMRKFFWLAPGTLRRMATSQSSIRASKCHLWNCNTCKKKVVTLAFLLMRRKKAA